MYEDLLKIGAILIVSIFIIYLMMNTFHLREGLENAEDTTTTEATDAVGANGEAGSAANYAAAIKAKTVKLQDSLLISKYRSDYENVIINMDDYLSMLMLKVALDLDASADIKTNAETLALMNTLSNAKKSLNETMAFIDKQ
jgi:hypothetical protein